MSDIKVSILCLVYNHGKYLRKTLEGFVSQKTNFAYEILIHDDASKDDSASIITEYAEKYPDLFRPILQTENQHSQKIPIWKAHVAHLVRGKYTALCEGDDYWSDPNKLQKQYDMMEANPDCSMCVHKVLEINEDGTSTEKYRPYRELAEGKYDVQQFLDIQRIYPFHTSSFFMKQELWHDHIMNPADFRKASDVGDEPLLLYMVAHGKIYYIPECMSAYRLFSVGSWSAANKRNIDRRILHAEKMYDMMCLYDEYTDHAYDCHLSVFKGQVYWLKRDYKALVKMDDKSFLKQAGLKKQIYAYACAYLPFLKKLRKRRKRRTNE